jgi:hypothetical protein
MMKLALMRTATGKEHPAVEDKFIRVNCTSNCSLHRVQVTDTSKHQLFRGDYVNLAFVVVLLQRNQN